MGGIGKRYISSQEVQRHLDTSISCDDIDRGFYGNHPRLQTGGLLAKNPYGPRSSRRRRYPVACRKKKIHKEEFLQMVDVENFEIAKTV